MTFQARLEPRAVRRLLSTVVSVATRTRPLPPGRAGVVQALATQLGLDFQGLAEVTREPKLRKTKSRSEAEATYLAAAVVLAADEPQPAEREALRKLGEALDLGVAVAELDRLAVQENALSGLARGEADPSASDSGSGAERRGLRDPGSEKRRAAAAVEPGSERRKAAAAAKKRRPGIESSGKRRRPRAAAADPAGGEAEPPRAGGIPPKTLALAGGGALALVLLLALGASLLLGGDDRGPPDVAEGSPSAGAPLRDVYTQAVKRWNRIIRAPDPAPVQDLVALRAALRDVSERGAASADAAEQGLGREARGLLADDFPGEWERSVLALRQRTEDAVLLAVQEGRFAEARTALQAIPPEAAQHSEVSGWRTSELGRIRQWEAYEEQVRGFLERPPQADLPALRRAAELYREGEAQEARVTAGYAALTEWLRDQREASDLLFEEIIRALMEKRDADALRDVAVLQLVETDLNAYLSRRPDEEVLLFLVLFDPEQREALLARLREGDPPPPAGSTGTGFFVGARHVLTNHHVVGEAQEVSVQTVDGHEHRGRVVAVERQLDLALVEMPAEGPPLALCEPAIRAGYPAFAYGYGRLGDDNRTLLVTRGAVAGIRDDLGFICFDGRVNPGNSGGPLVDAGGRWLGVVVRKTRSEEFVDSFGFAIHGALARRWLETLGLEVLQEAGLPQGEVPPDADVRRSVVRIVSTD